MSTAREEIITALKAQGWSIQEFTDAPQTQSVYARWHRRALLVDFDVRDRITAAYTKRPEPFNSGQQRDRLVDNRRQQILAFIRGEQV